MINDNKNTIWFVGSLLVLAAISRVLPHPANVTPVAAMALFGGAYINNKRWALLLPLAWMLFSDFLLQIMYWAGLRAYTGFSDIIPFVYGSLLLTALLGSTLQKRLTPLPILASSMAASVIFFLITNFGVWLSWMPHTFDGFVQCYTQAIPFFRASALGDLVYTGAFFGIAQVVRSQFPKWNWA